MLEVLSYRKSLGALALCLQCHTMPASGAVTQTTEDTEERRPRDTRGFVHRGADRASLRPVWRGHDRRCLAGHGPLAGAPPPPVPPGPALTACPPATERQAQPGRRRGFARRNGE